MTDVDGTIPSSDTAQPASAFYSGQAVVFYLSGQQYAITIDRVQEIQQIVAFSEVPGGGAGVVGMVNLRGHVIPAVDLRRIVGLPAEEFTLETPMIICRTGPGLVACVVDEVQDVIDIEPGAVQEAPKVHALASRMLGVARLDDGLVYLLDVDEILSTVMPGGW